MINIALASDDNYAQHLAVTLCSLLEHTQSKVHFYVLDNGISAAKKELVAQTVARFAAQLSFLPVTLPGLEQSFVSGHLSPAAYSRLLLAELLPESVDKIIYLDVDLLVLQDIRQLWEIPLQGRPLGAAYDLGLMSSKRMQQQKHSELGLALEQEGYFNSGVLVLDIAQWRSQHYGEQLLELITQHSYRHHDQDALNKLFKGNWTVLPLAWNVIPPVYYLFPKLLLNSRYKQLAQEARAQLAILHFAGRTKPWEFACTKGYNELYYHYLKQTAFAEVRMPQPSRDMHKKSVARQVWRGKLAQLLQHV